MEEFDEKLEEVKVIKGLSVKVPYFIINQKSIQEIKDKVRPDFEANPDKYYPTQFLATIDFNRNKCTKCGHMFWKHNKNPTELCGDSKYEFFSIF